MAVYTTVTTEDFAAFLTGFDIGQAVSLSPIASGIENSNYLAQTTAGKFILTLFEKRVKPQELPYFMGLMTHLHNNGVVCPLPVCGKDGAPLHELCGKTACLTTFLNGASVTEITPEHCAELGQGMAKMHLASVGYDQYRPNDLSVEGWGALLKKIGDTADEIDAGLAKEMADAYHEIKAAFPTGLPQGVIHADLFPDNVFFENDRLSGIIDFYFACNDAPVYELAVCLNAWCFTPDTWDYDARKAKAMVAAYQAVRPLSQAEKDAFPVLARGAALRFLLTRTYDWLNRVEGALVTPKNPKEYVKKLRFHRTMKTWEDYFG